VRTLTNSARSFHSSVFVNGSVYLFSGSNGTEKFSDVWKFQVRETPPPLLTLAARALCTHAANQLAAANQLSSSSVTAAVTAANQRDAARCDVPLTSTVTTVTLSTVAGPRATAGTTARAIAVSHRHQHQPQQQQQLIQQHEQQQQQQQAVAPCAGCSYVHASKINECCAAKAALMRG
jgi:Galactose oxidase, central domain